MLDTIAGAEYILSPRDAPDPVASPLHLAMQERSWCLWLAGKVWEQDQLQRHLRRDVHLGCRAGPPDPGECLRSPGWGGYLLIGTPKQIVDRLMHLTAMVWDRVVLSWVDYAAALAYWISDVLPVMKQAGLRRPYVSAHAGS